MTWPDWLQERTIASLRAPRARRWAEKDLAGFIWLWTIFGVIFILVGGLYMALADDGAERLQGMFFMLFWLLFSVYQVDRAILAHRVIQLEAA